MLELIKLRASQINGCAYCIHLHATALRHFGETDIRLYLLDAWRGAPQYMEQERATLALKERLTWLSATEVDEAEYAILEATFTPEEKVHHHRYSGQATVVGALLS